MKLERILVPVDFSEYSDAAVRAACALARRGSAATITLLHVVPPRSTGIVAIEPMFAPPQVIETLYQERRANAENELEALEGLARRLAGEVDISTEIEPGDALEVILRYAEQPCDLVVMGSHGLTGAARFLLGSTAEKVARESPCPVLVTPADDLDRDQVPSFGRVLVGIDYSPASELVARTAAAVAGQGSKVELCHVWPEPSFFVSGGDSRQAGELQEAVDQQRTREADRLAATAGVLRLEDVETTTYLATGAPTDGLLDRAEQTEPDLIAVGAHGRETLAEKILGTVADRILRHAECPVLLVPPPARDPTS